MGMLYPCSLVKLLRDGWRRGLATRFAHSFWMVFRRGWKDGMGGGGTFDGGEPFLSWTEHEDCLVLYAKDMLLRCPWPAEKEE